jgi:hypothetical protein
MTAKKGRHKKPKARKTRPAKAKLKASGKGRRKVPAKHRRKRRPVRGKAINVGMVTFGQRGLGARSGGQSGDTQGLSASPAVDSESVEELLEEGQAYEAEVLNGVERARDPDESEVTTREVTEDDVPEEYHERD